MLIKAKMGMISMEEVAKHNSPDDCWVVLHGQVYDLTEFHASHPGGSAIITDYAGMVRLVYIYICAQEN